MAKKKGGKKAKEETKILVVEFDNNLQPVNYEIYGNLTLAVVETFGDKNLYQKIAGEIRENSKSYVGKFRIYKKVVRKNSWTK